MTHSVPTRLRHGEYAVVSWAGRSDCEHPIGVLLLDPVKDRLHISLRSGWKDIADPDETLVLAGLEEDFRNKAREMGGTMLLGCLEDSLSNALRISNRRPVTVDSFVCTLYRLFDKHVHPVVVLPFQTHLPLYSLRAAASRFGEEMAVDEEDWVRVSGLHLDQGMFVAHVVGPSMEPLIPDGSLNVFRAPVVGTRQSKIVLVELLGTFDDNARYTVKKYVSEKKQVTDEEWEHESIRLKPLNPEFDAITLAPGDFRVIAEWVGVLD